MAQNLLHFNLPKSCLVSAIRCPEGVLLIDAGTPEGVEHIAAELKAASFVMPRYVLITHDHWDHTKACKAWRDLGAQIVMEAGEAAGIEDGTASLVPCPVDIRLRPDQELNLLGMPIMAYRAPGHTPGSVAYDLTVDGERWLFTGDLVMLNLCPGWLGQFDLEDTLATLQRLARLPVNSIATGHSTIRGDGTGLLVDSLLAAFDGTWYRNFQEHVEQFKGRPMPKVPEGR